MNPKVNFYFDKSKKWRLELGRLRTMILGCGLEEELKWGVPCYTVASNSKSNKPGNVVLIHTFKAYCAVLFFKGALMKDEAGILIQQTKNVQAARQIRFTNVNQIKTLEADIKAYVFEAIEIEKAGLKIVLNKSVDLNLTEELQQEFQHDSNFEKAFSALTPGRQRAYNLHFSGAKQAATRLARIEKAREKIFLGKGPTDR
ncbi:uncharacterized protein YdeI (YjbR/CyaY-like superfamily) [Pedobacter sp. UYEF25]